MPFPVLSRVTRADLPRRALAKLRFYLSAFTSIHSRHRPIWAQCRDMLRLRFGPTRVGVSDYISQGMYSEQVYPNRNPRSLGGWWFKEHVHAQLNELAWEGMVTDKLIMYALFDQYGLPHPRVHAAVWTRARSYPGVPVLNTVAQVANFLRQAGPLYPLFCKPVKGSYGRGAALLRGYHASDDSLLLDKGERETLGSFLHSLEDDGWGVLIQEAITAPEETQALCGEAVSGCRVIMLLEDDQALPYRVVWKLPARDNILDNFQGGASGNTIAAVDVRSGKVLRALHGKGAALKLIERHPDSGVPLIGTQVPQWSAMMALLRKAALCFPGFRWQHWDVGLSARGPVLYELNSAGNTDIAQMAYGEGINDRQLKDFLRKHGRRDKQAPA